MTKRYLLAAAFVALLPAAGFAQQKPPQTQPAVQAPQAAVASPFDVVLKVMNDNAQQVGAQRLLIDSLQRQVADLEKRCGDACKVNPEPAAPEPPK